MHLIIDNYAVKIEVEDEQFKISTEENVRFASALKISSINILKPCLITTSALVLAAKNQVPVLLYNHTGDVEAWVWSAQYGSIATLRRNQVYFTQSKQGLLWMQNLLQQKFQLQISNLKWLANRIPSFAIEIQQTIAKMQTFDAQHNELELEKLRAKEAYLAREYWQQIAVSMERYTSFENREKRNAEQTFNQYINYAYGILYGIVESSLLMTGVDPYMGILHIDRHDKPALAFDHIEPFRPWIDKLVMELYITQQICDDDIEIDEENKEIIVLSKRKLLIDAFFKLMGEKAQLHHKRYKRIDHIHYCSQQLANQLKAYTP